MTSQEEAYAVLQQKTTQQTAEATSLSQQSTDIEKKKAEAEALANTIREKQKAIEQKTQQNQSTLQMVSRQGGDVSQFNPLVVAEYQKDVQNIQSDIALYNPKVESLSKEIDAYNIRAITFQVSQENLSKEIDVYNTKIDVYNTKIERQKAIIDEFNTPQWKKDDFHIQSIPKTGDVNDPFLSQKEIAEKYKSELPLDIYNQMVDIYTKYDLAVERQKEFNTYLQNVAEGREAGVQTVDIRLTSRPHPRDPNTLTVGYRNVISAKLPSQSEYISGETQVRNEPDWQKSIKEWGIAGAKSYYGLGSEDIIRVEGVTVQESSFTPEQISITSQVSSGRLSALAQYEQAQAQRQEQLKAGMLLGGTAIFASGSDYAKIFQENIGRIPTMQEQMYVQTPQTQQQLIAKASMLSSPTAQFADINFVSAESQKLSQLSGLTITPLGTEQFKFKSPESFNVIRPELIGVESRQLDTLQSQPLQSSPIDIYHQAGFGVLTPQAYAERYGLPFAFQGTEQQKDVYAKNWWSGLSSMEKIEVGANTFFQNILSGGAKSILEGKNAFTPTLAYETTKEMSKGSFTDVLLKNEALITIATAEAFGIGLGAISLKYPTAAKIIGGGAIAIGAGEIGYTAYKGDYQTALAGTLGFALATPFAMQGYGIGRGIKGSGSGDLFKVELPDLNVNTVKFGQSITPEHMTTTGILVGAGLKLIEPIGIKTSEISLGVSRYLSDVNLKITNTYKDLSYNIRGGSIEKGITPIKNTPYYEYGYKSQLTENLIPEYKKLELPQTVKDFIYSLNRGSISAIGQKPIRNIPYYEYGYETMLGEKYIPTGSIKQKYISPYSYTDIPNILESSVYRMKKDLSYSFNKGQIQTGISPQVRTPYYEYGYSSMLGEIRPSVKGKSIFEVFDSKVSDIGYKLDYELTRKLSVGFEIKDVLSESSRRMVRDIYDITPKMPKNLHDKFNLALYNRLNRAFGGYDVRDVRIKVEGLSPEEIFIPYKSIAKGQKGMITAKRDWMVIDAEISIGKVKTNPMKALRQQWKLQEQSFELNKLEKSITDSFKKEPVMPGTTLLKSGKSKGFQSAYAKILEEMMPESSTSQTLSSKKTDVVRDRTKALKKKWKAEADKIQLSSDVAKELGFIGQRQIVIQKQEVKTKPIIAETKPRTQYKSATQQIKEANKEMEKIVSATKRKQKSSIYPIFFPLLSESVEYDYSRTYPQKSSQKSQLITSNSIKSSHLLSVNMQKEQQKQQSFNIQKPFSISIPKLDIGQSYREIQKNIPSELSALKSLEKITQKELSIQTPKLRTAQREDIAQVPKFAFPVLSKSDIPRQKQHKSHRKVSAYTIKNQFAGLDDLLGDFDIKTGTLKKKKRGKK